MRIVAHVDMDAFFAAVEERYNPQFRGRPLVVGADPKVCAAPGGGEPRPTGRGVVATASYAARRYGIHSAMPISRAWRLAEEARQRGEPATIFLTGNYELYAEVSERIMAILARHADAFEQASIDEAYLELNFQFPIFNFQNDPWKAAIEKAERIKREIFEQEGLTCSIGVGPNKLIAKIASDFRKPDGLTIVRLEDVETFLAPLPIRAIPGIGPKTEIALHRHGIKTISQLQTRDRAWLTRMFGAWGSDLWDKARGISESKVSSAWIPKSLGEEETFETDTLQASFVLDRTKALVDAVFARLRQEGFVSFRTVVVRIRFRDFETLTRSHTSRQPLATRDALAGEALRLLLPFLDRRANPGRKKIRLIGVRVERILR